MGWNSLSISKLQRLHRWSLLNIILLHVTTCGNKVTTNVVTLFWNIGYNHIGSPKTLLALTLVNKCVIVIYCPSPTETIAWHGHLLDIDVILAAILFGRVCKNISEVKSPTSMSFLNTCYTQTFVLFFHQFYTYGILYLMENAHGFIAFWFVLTVVLVLVLVPAAVK